MLLPIDLSHESSWRFALPEALACVRASSGRLTVITVVRDINAMLEGLYLSFQLEGAVAEARQRLAALVRGQDCEGLDISNEVRFGSIGAEILAAAEACQADLIVMQSHRPEMRDYLIGPNAAFVAQHARCSVLVLRQPANPAR
ncbi:MAG: universal stress protein [Rhodospirillaceae bacterium]|nr:universal stress protein [Rhodospirillaceae bacterium]